jgi:hypothetical protein
MVHPGGLEPPCLAAAASEAAASAVSPRVQYGAATADRTPVSALPKRRLPLHDCGVCGGVGWRTRTSPLAYKASALPDELSQRCKSTKGSRRRSRNGSDLIGAPKLGAASKSGRSQCQRARRHRHRSHRRMDSWNEGARACAYALGARVEFEWTSVSSAGHLPSCLSGGGETLRRLFRFQPGALLGPIEGTGEAPIAARAYGQPIVRSIRPSGGGAERGGDM